MHSTDKLARLTGLLYLILLPTAGVGFGVGQLVMGTDAAATLANIEANRGFFELAIVLGAVGFVDFLLVALAFHRLLAPTGRAAANLLLALVIVSVPLSLAAMAARMDILLLLDGASATRELAGVQVMHELLRSNNLILVSSIFWGLWLLPLGWLVIRSGFVPRILGVLLLVGSVFYVLTFAGAVFDTGYADSLLGRVVGTVFGIPGMIGEVGTALWLLAMGARRLAKPE